MKRREFLSCIAAATGAAVLPHQPQRVYSFLPAVWGDAIVFDPKVWIGHALNRFAGAVRELSREPYPNHCGSDEIMRRGRRLGSLPVNLAWHYEWSAQQDPFTLVRLEKYRSILYPREADGKFPSKSRAYYAECARIERLPIVIGKSDAPRWV